MNGIHGFSSATALAFFRHQNTILPKKLRLKFGNESGTSPPLSDKKITRKRYSSELNVSIARKLSKCSETVKNQEEINDAIVDHAYRRIQIFYYQAVVYYKKHCDIFLSKTAHQHGKGQFTWTNAAHSSLLTNLVDNDKGFINPQIQLYASMNATVELPIEVNNIDSVIENNLRSEALDLLNFVAKGLHPYAATTILTQELQQVLDKIIEETQIKLNELRRLEKLEKQIVRLEGIGKDIPKYSEAAKSLKTGYKYIKNLNGFSINHKIKNKFTILSEKKFKATKHNKGKLGHLKKYIDSLNRSLKYVHKIKKGTVLPPDEFLFGGYGNEEFGLFLHQHEILSNRI